VPARPSALPPLAVIGVVRGGRTDLADTPVQSAVNPSEQAAVELNPEYADGLLGLEGFDYAWLLTWLGRPDEPAEPPSLRQVPFLLSQRPQTLGIFATRGPRRVNPIGLSLVRLGPIHHATVEFSGVDMIDGTPVLDIKPYVTRFDCPPVDVRCGWFDDVAIAPGVTPAQLRGVQPPP